MIPSQNRIKISVKGDTSVLLGVKGLNPNGHSTFPHHYYYEEARQRKQKKSFPQFI